MVVYIVLFLLVGFGALHFDILKRKHFMNPYFIFVGVFCTLMVGLRYRVGGDALVYEDYYYLYPDISNYLYFIDHKVFLNYQPLWVLFVAICKTFNSDYYFYQFMYSVVFNMIWLWFIKKHSNNPFTVLFILVINLLYFYFGYEVQREMFAISCFLLGYDSFQKNKWIKYYIFAIIAFYFHISATILFIMPFFKLIKFTNKFIIISILVSIPLIVGKTLFYDLISALYVTESMQERGEVYSKVGFSVSGVLFFYFLRVIVFLPFLFYSVKIKKGNSNDWLLAAFLVLSLLSQVLVGFDRMLNYIYIPIIIYFVDLIYSEMKLLYHVKANFIKLSFHVGLFGILLVKLFISNYGNYHYYSVFFPYGSIFEKEKNTERENYLIKLWKQ
ncbi:EpsG family protein [Soonwooa buanensis]|uniref:EpsG family protein n=1 Tax=Soonwooa buanensis TaxID=619805 RepID=A0A1T5EUF0_9FLAO|nr:EpsG family protein [Soonwooa buanensis]SKB87488.1 EpsG family protein [Soonwooa buanensis]